PVIATPPGPIVQLCRRLRRPVQDPGSFHGPGSNDVRTTSFLHINLSLLRICRSDINSTSTRLGLDISRINAQIGNPRFIADRAAAPHFAERDGVRLESIEIQVDDPE